MTYFIWLPAFRKQCQHRSKLRKIANNKKECNRELSEKSKPLVQEAYFSVHGTQEGVKNEDGNGTILVLVKFYPCLQFLKLYYYIFILTQIAMKWKLSSDIVAYLLQGAWSLTCIGYSMHTDRTYAVKENGLKKKIWSRNSIMDLFHSS